MKKVFLGLAVMASLLVVSCKETTQDKVEDAIEALRLARVNNGKLITDRNQYVRNLLDSKNALTDAQDALAAHLEKIAFLQEQYDSLDA